MYRTLALRIAAALASEAGPVPTFAALAAFVAVAAVVAGVIGGRI